MLSNNNLAIKFIHARHLLLLLLLNSFSPVLIAQSSSMGGLIVGVSKTNFVNADFDGYDDKQGVLLGAFLNFGHQNGHVSFQPEFLYANYGARIPFRNAKVKLAVNYLQFPALIKLKYVPKTTAPAIYIGPYMGFLVSSKTRVNSSSNSVNDATRFIDYGMKLGAGLESKSLVFGARYTIGFRNVFKDEFDDGERNSGISFFLGLKL